MVTNTKLDPENIKLFEHLGRKIREEINSDNKTMKKHYENKVSPKVQDEGKLTKKRPIVYESFVNSQASTRINSLNPSKTKPFDNSSPVFSRKRKFPEGGFGTDKKYESKRSKDFDFEHRILSQNKELENYNNSLKRISEYSSDEESITQEPK